MSIIVIMVMAAVVLQIGKALERAVAWIKRPRLRLRRPRRYTFN